VVKLLAVIAVVVIALPLGLLLAVTVPAVGSAGGVYAGGPSRRKFSICWRLASLSGAGLCQLALLTHRFAAGNPGYILALDLIRVRCFRPLGDPVSTAG
jgi:hypothetical protein